MSAPEQRGVVRHGVARILSKLGLCSRSEAMRWIAEGRVRINGRLVTDPESPVRNGIDTVSVDGSPVAATQRRYLMLNKPRGLVTSRDDEHGRPTIYRCLEGQGLPWLAPVGRLDRASEGLLLVSNDSVWAAAITEPDKHVPKRYHVRVDRLPDDALIAALHSGVNCEGEHLAVLSARELRRGARNSWLELVIDEGRNRHLRRLLEALDCEVQRLVRVAIGTLELGELRSGQWRDLDDQEIRALAPPTPA